MTALLSKSIRDSQGRLHKRMWIAMGIETQRAR
jgi:hypothetical protein